MEELNREFEEFFVHCQKITSSEQELRSILKPLRVQLQIQQFKKFCKILLVVGAICSAIYYIETLNWYFCAFGRIAMIKMLPFYDWRWLSEAKCLVARVQPAAENTGNPTDVILSDCRACENFGKTCIHLKCILRWLILFNRNNQRRWKHEVQHHLRHFPCSRSARNRQWQHRIRKILFPMAFHRKHLCEHVWHDSKWTLQLWD